MFVGIAESTDVNRYLNGVSYATVPDLATEDGHNLAVVSGMAPEGVPQGESFWVEKSTGPGRQSITWPIADGSWSIVVMNADASQGIDFSGDVGAEVPVLRPMAVGLLIVGGVMLLVSIALIVGGVARAGVHTDARRTQ